MYRSSLRLLPLGLALGLANSAAIAQDSTQAGTVPTLAPVTVTGQLGMRSLDRGIAQERALLERVAGGTNLVQPKQEIKLVTLTDALAHQPGIVMQEFFGNWWVTSSSARPSAMPETP